MSASSSWRSRNENNEDEDLDDNILTDAQEVRHRLLLGQHEMEENASTRTILFKQ